jgi:hypothetical protein
VGGQVDLQVGQLGHGRGSGRGGLGGGVVEAGG